MPRAKKLVPDSLNGHGGEVVWRDRIVGLSDVSVDDLIPNPNNFRRHPIHQRTLFKDAVDEVGIVSPLFRNIRTGFLVDGHMRLEELKSAGVKTVKVLDIDVDEDEETTVLLTLDAVSAMAFEDALHKSEVLRLAKTGNAGLAEYYKRELERQEAEALSQRDMDEIAEEYGDHDPRAFWPVIRMRVSPDVRARFLNYFKGLPGETDNDRLDVLCDRLKAPYVEADEFAEVAGD